MASRGPTLVKRSSLSRREKHGPAPLFFFDFQSASHTHHGPLAAAVVTFGKNWTLAGFLPPVAQDWARSKVSAEQARHHCES